MLCQRSLLLLPLLFLFASTFVSSSEEKIHSPFSGVKKLIAENSRDGNESITVNSSSLVLAEHRTYRKDPFNSFKRYTGGWNISEKHYWASVAYTSAPFFIVGAIWFVVFGLSLFSICFYYCCCSRVPYGYSRTAYALSLILLILFTISACVGCIILYIGQGKFNNSTSNTLHYVVNQANTTSEKLKDVSEYLDAAQGVGVEQISLAANIQKDIDNIQTKINSSATTLSIRTTENSEDIKRIIKIVRLILIVLSAVMLVITFLGFAFSLCGMQFFVYILVIAAWILVTGTFILCGVFLVLHNVTGDTCVAMDEWVQHPTAQTALDDILPCVDNATAQETVTKSKEVTSQLVNLINQVITNVSNVNFPPSFVPLYYNQSGPLMPTLCNPFFPDLTNRVCTPGELLLDNATQVLRGYVCQVENSVCVTTGRLTPQLHSQIAAGVNVSYGLYNYGPFLASLQDCSFVRQTFTDIQKTYCPGLKKYTRWIYSGLLMVSIAVLLSILFWVIYGRERRHRVYTKEHMPGSGQNETDDKDT